MPDGITTEIAPFYNGERASWAPLPGSQELFLNCPDFEVLFAGTRGGGKTATLVMDFCQHVGVGYGSSWKGLLFRKTYPELRDVVDKTRALLPVVYGDRVKFNETKMTWTWDTGEQLILAHMNQLSDYDKYHGKEYPWQGWEELTLWAQPDCYRKMMSCCRSSNPSCPRKMRATTNPYGPGFGWVKERFQLPFAPGSMVGKRIENSSITGHKSYRRAFNSHVRENLVLLHADPGYIDRIAESASNDAEREAWLNGSWDITAGGMFDDIWHRVRDVAVVPPFLVPETWRIDRCFDWGSSKPFSVGWYAQSNGTPVIFPNGRIMHTVPGDLFRIKEWYGWDGNANKGCRMLARDIAKGIIEREIEWGLVGRVRRGVADASIFDEQNGCCVANDMAKRVKIDGKDYVGVHFDKGDSTFAKLQRKQGWEQMRKMMSSTVPETPGTPREFPGLFVTTDCHHFLRTVPVLPRDKKDQDDVDTEAEDHVADEVRYRCRKELRIIKGGRTKGLS